MRLFLAITPPKDTLDGLFTSQSQLLPFLTSGRPVDRQNFHITLHFLGEVAEDRLIYVENAMQQAKNFQKFSMSVAQISTMQSAKIVCAKFKTSKTLIEIHQAVGEKLSQNGFSVENRVFRPHLTLIRQFKFNSPFTEVAKHIDVFNKPFEVDAIKLMKTTFHPNGVQYQTLSEVHLD